MIFPLFFSEALKFKVWRKENIQEILIMTRGWCQASLQGVLLNRWLITRKKIPFICYFWDGCLCFVNAFFYFICNILAGWESSKSILLLLVSYGSFNHGRDGGQLKKINGLILRPQNKEWFYWYLTDDFFDESLKRKCLSLFTE